MNEFSCSNTRLSGFPTDFALLRNAQRVCISLLYLGIDDASSFGKVLQDGGNNDFFDNSLWMVFKSSALVVSDQLSKCKRVCLYDISIRESDAIMLASSLASNSTISSFEVQYTNLTDSFAHELAKTLKLNKVLKSLYLAYNYISDEGVKELSQALVSNEYLIDLDLRRNVGTELGIFDIIDVVKDRYTPLCIYFTHSALDRKLRLSSKFHIDLSGCSQSFDTLPFIYRFLDSNLHCKSLDLSFNYLGWKGISNLLEHISSNISLEKLNLTSCFLPSHYMNQQCPDVAKMFRPQLVDCILKYVKSELISTELNVSRNLIDSSHVGKIVAAAALTRSNVKIVCDVENDFLLQRQIDITTKSLPSFHPLSHSLYLILSYVLLLFIYPIYFTALIYAGMFRLATSKKIGYVSIFSVLKFRAFDFSFDTKSFITMSQFIVLVFISLVIYLPLSISACFNNLCLFIISSVFVTIILICLVTSLISLRYDSYFSKFSLHHGFKRTEIFSFPYICFIISIFLEGLQFISIGFIADGYPSDFVKRLFNLFLLRFFEYNFLFPSFIVVLILVILLLYFASYLHVCFMLPYRYSAIRFLSNRINVEAIAWVFANFLFLYVVVTLLSVFRCSIIDSDEYYCSSVSSPIFTTISLIVLFLYVMISFFVFTPFMRQYSIKVYFLESFLLFERFCKLLLGFFLVFSPDIQVFTCQIIMAVIFAILLISLLFHFVQSRWHNPSSPCSLSWINMIKLIFYSCGLWSCLSPLILSYIDSSEDIFFHLLLVCIGFFTIVIIVSVAYTCCWCCHQNPVIVPVQLQSLKLPARGESFKMYSPRKRSPNPEFAESLVDECLEIPTPISYSTIEEPISPSAMMKAQSELKVEVDLSLKLPQHSPSAGKQYISPRADGLAVTFAPRTMLYVESSDDEANSPISSVLPDEANSPISSVLPDEVNSPISSVLPDEVIRTLYSV